MSNDQTWCGPKVTSGCNICLSGQAPCGVEMVEEVAEMHYAMYCRILNPVAAVINLNLNTKSEMLRGASQNSLDLIVLKCIV